MSSLRQRTETGRMENNLNPIKLEVIVWTSYAGEMKAGTTWMKLDKLNSVRTINQSKTHSSEPTCCSSSLNVINDLLISRLSLHYPVKTLLCEEVLNEKDRDLLIWDKVSLRLTL